MNRELITKIRDLVSTEPDKLEMSSWEDGDTDCGTTRCIAGWAVHLTTGRPLFTLDDDEYPVLHESVVRLAGDAGIDPATHSVGRVIQEVAANLLEIPADPYHVFHTTNERALEWLDENSNPEV